MRIKHFRQTVFVTKDHYVKCVAGMQDWDGCNPFTISAFIGDRQILRPRTFWENEVELDLSTVSKPCVLTLKLYPFQNSAVIQDFDFAAINSESRRIVSIWDKEMECELMGASCRFAMGEGVYVHTEQKHALPITMEFPSRRRLDVYSGALATEVVLESFEEQIGPNFRTVFTFYRNEKTLTCI